VNCARSCWWWWRLARYLDTHLSSTPGAVQLLHALRLIGARHHHDLLPALLENTVQHAVLVQQGAQRQQVFVDSNAEGRVKICHQFTNALLQRSLSLQLA
jgi:hypothetical protein